MSDQNCVLDENGLCKVHTPGSPEMLAAENGMVTAVLDAIKQGNLQVIHMGITLKMAAPLIDEQNAKRRELGQPELELTERKIIEILDPYFRAVRTAVDALSELVKPQTLGDSNN